MKSLIVHIHSYNMHHVEIHSYYQAAQKKLSFNHLILTFNNYLVVVTYHFSSFLDSDGNWVSSCKLSAVLRTPPYQLHTHQNIAADTQQVTHNAS